MNDIEKSIENLEKRLKEVEFAVKCKWEIFDILLIINISIIVIREFIMPLLQWIC